MRLTLAPPWQTCLLVTLLLTPSPSFAQLLEDPPEVLKPDETLTEARDDHVEAVALLTHGRALLHRRDLPGALRRFQRAWRFDNELVSIMNEIVPLAITLKRDGEATRYALIAAEQQDVPLEVIENLAALLADRDQFSRALALYQKCEREGSTNVLIQFEIGRLALLEGEFKKSADAFAKVQAALEAKGKDQLPNAKRRQMMNKPELTYALMGESFLRAERLSEAESAFRAADAAKPNAATLGLRLAFVESARGNRVKALEELQKYFESKTSSAGMSPYQLLVKLVDRPDQDGQKGSDRDPAAKPSAELLDKLRQLVSADPDNAMLGYFAADQLRRADHLDEASVAYEKLLKQASAADGFVGLCDIYLRQRKLKPLMMLIGDAVAKTSSLDPLGTALDPVIEDPETRREMLKIAQAILDDTEQDLPLGVLMALALLEAQAEEIEAAERFLELALQRSGPGKGPFAVNFGFQMLQLQQPRRAADTFQRVIDERLLPDRIAELHYYLAGAWALADDPDKAIAAVRKAAELAPGSSQMASRVAWTLYQAKRVPDAEDAYFALLDRFDSDFGSTENREVMRDIRMVLSNILVEQGRLDAAEEWLQQVLDEFPEYVGAMNDLGYLWCDRGKHLDRSLDMIQKAVAEEPDNVAYRDSLGWALYRLERYDEALVELEKAAKNDEQVDGVIMDHLGDAYLKTNQREQAINAWKKAVAVFEEQQDSERLGQIREKLDRHDPKQPR